MKREPNEQELKSRERVIYLINTYCDGSQNEFAQRVGINKSSVSQYVNGRNFPSNERAGEIARAFGLNPLWVMGFNMPMRATQEERKAAAMDKMIEAVEKSVEEGKKRQAFRTIAESITELNDEGVSRLLEYAGMLTQSDTYKKGR